jgi:fructose-1,6-bisphosphatase/inositol monophosphatase family enzyme
MPTDPRALMPSIVELHDRIRSAVVAACEAQTHDAMSAVDHDDAGDTIYVVDRVSETTLIEGLTELARHEPLVLIAEGLPPEGLILPRGTPERDCRWRLLVDPIDGTRGLMYQKRSAWILTGVAPNLGSDTRLRDIVLAVQTEIPLVKQHLCDQLWAVRGRGGAARRINRLTAESEDLIPHPSRADTIAHGFATVARFFPGARDILAAIDDEIMLAVGGPAVAGKAICFEDQYISTGGQLYELMMGHDRFVADLRPLLHDVLIERGMQHPLCCHPYDLCTVLIAEELGLAVTDANGNALDTPLDLDTDVSWVAYANDRLRKRVEPALRAALKRHL